MSTILRSSERLEPVLQVSGQLFVPHEYQATSTREIARMADISENSYSGFENKEQIFGDLFWVLPKQQCSHTLRLKQSHAGTIRNMGNLSPLAMACLMVQHAAIGLLFLQGENYLLRLSRYSAKSPWRSPIKVPRQHDRQLQESRTFPSLPV